MSKENKICHKTSIGGQAVIEGIMMRGPRSSALSVRVPSGEIDTTITKNTSISNKYKLLKLPFIRGSVNFVEMMFVGYNALTLSAEKAGLEDELGETKFEKWLKKSFDGNGVKILMYISMVIGVLLSIALFIGLPMLITNILTIPAIKNVINIDMNNFRAIIEGVVRITILFLYLFLVSKMRDIQRTFEYHGAEHKTIHTYEAEEELIVENVKKHSRLHPRCGTSFLVIATLCSILVFWFIKTDIWFPDLGQGVVMLIRFGLKLLLLPIVVGISYEIIKLAGRHNNLFTKIVSAPGMLFQKLTTRDPDDSQIEVAIEALKAVLTEDKEDDKW